MKRLPAPISLALLATLLAVGSHAAYEVERVEQFEDWPDGYVFYKQNEREDYYLTYFRFDVPPTTHVTVSGRRHFLQGFRAFNINDLGQLAGSLWLSRTIQVGVIWSPDSGFRVVEGGPVAYPHRITNAGVICGSAYHYYTPCIWVNGRLTLINGVTGVAVDAREDGLVAGHLPDGGHGDYPWIYENGTARWLNESFAISRILPGDRLLGNYSEGYSGCGLIYDIKTGESAFMPGGHNNWVAGMNDSSVAVGILSYGVAWEFNQPNIWKPDGSGGFTVHDPYILVEHGWRNLWVNGITNTGVILGEGNFNGGPTWLIRLRPINRH